MVSNGRVVLATVLVVCVGGILKTVDAREQVQSSAVAGRVLDDTGSPVGQAIVTLSQLGSPPERVLTTAEGLFRFSVPPGTYQLAVSKTGLVRTALSSTPVEVIVNAVTSLDMRLSRASAISGRVIDWNGEPVTGIAVRLFVKSSYGGLPLFRLMAAPEYNCTTDDRGVFRCSGIVPGQYLVALLAAKSPLTGSTVPQPIRLPEFHPSGSSFSNARPIDVAPGESYSAVDFVVAKASYSTVSGRVEGLETGENVQITLEGRREQSSVEIARTQVRPDGTFQFTQVPSGRWVASLKQTGRAPGAALAIQADERNARIMKPSPASQGVSATPGSAYSGEKDVTVERDVKDLSVQALRGAKLCGTARFEKTGQTPDRQEISRMQVWIASSTRPDAAFPLIAMDGEGSFCSPELPHDDYVITVRPVAKDWFLRAITMAGQQAPGGSAVAVRGRDVNVIVAFSNRAAGVAGTVNDSSGRAVSNARVALFPVDRTLWTGWGNAPLRFSEVRTNRDGRFSVPDLLPGDYLVSLVAGGDEWRTPNTLAGLVGRATKTTAREGQVQTVAIRSY